MEDCVINKGVCLKQPPLIIKIRAAKS